MCTVLEYTIQVVHIFAYVLAKVPILVAFVQYFFANVVVQVQSFYSLRLSPRKVS